MPKTKRKPSGRTSARVIQGAERRAQALDLRRRGLSYRAIGAELGCSGKTAHQHVRLALAHLVEMQDESAGELRELELQRIDGVIATLTTLSERGDVTASDKLLKAIDLRAKLLGLHAPQRNEVTGKDGEPIAVTNYADLLLASAKK